MGYGFYSATDKPLPTVLQKKTEIRMQSLVDFDQWGQIK